MKFLILILIYFINLTIAIPHSTKKKNIKAHEHGVGILNIAQEGKNLLIEFEIPGSDIVGFEYEAKEENDIEKVKNALEILNNYKNMIKPSGVAQCEQKESSAKIINEGKHSEFVGRYSFNCENISQLKIFYLKYFSSFENSKKLNIKIFGSVKKSAFVISKPKKLLNVKGYF